MTQLLIMMKDAFVLWSTRGGDYMAAAVSYYAIFALVPLIFVSVFIVSQFFGEALVTRVLLSWGSGMGAGVLMLLQSAVKDLPNSPVLLLAPIGTLTFLLGAVLIFFTTFTEGLHQLWGYHSEGFADIMRKTWRALVAVIVLQLFIIGFIAAEFSFTLMLQGAILRSYALAGMYIVALSVLFTLCYSLLPLGNKPSLVSRIYGATIAAALFSLGKSTVSIHIALTPVPDLFGAAGIAVVMVLWVYVSVSFVYYGAAFAHVHDKRRRLLEHVDDVVIEAV